MGEIVVEIVEVVEDVFVCVIVCDKDIVAVDVTVVDRVRDVVVIGVAVFDGDAPVDKVDEGEAVYEFERVQVGEAEA